jgi:hypothetical protein
MLKPPGVSARHYTSLLISYSMDLAWDLAAMREEAGEDLFWEVGS